MLEDRDHAVAAKRQGDSVAVTTNDRLYEGALAVRAPARGLSR